MKPATHKILAQLSKFNLETCFSTDLIEKPLNIIEFNKAISFLVSHYHEFTLTEKSIFYSKTGELLRITGQLTTSMQF